VFRRLLRHPARKRSGPILQPGRTRGADVIDEYVWSAHWRVLWPTDAWTRCCVHRGPADRCLDPLLCSSRTGRQMSGPAAVFIEDRPTDVWTRCCVHRGPADRCLDPLLCSSRTDGLGINPANRVPLYAECVDVICQSAGPLTYQWSLYRRGLNGAWLPIADCDYYATGPLLTPPSLSLSLSLCATDCQILFHMSAKNIRHSVYMVVRVYILQISC